MPLQVEGLTPVSSEEEVQDAISASISQCMREGRPQDQCIAMAYEMARNATGKILGRGEYRKTSRRITG